MLAQMLQTPPHFISTTIFLITHIRAFGTEKWVYSKQPWQELARLQKHYPRPRPLFNELASSGPYGPLLARSGYPGQDSSFYYNPMVMICATVNALNLL